jgi:hypothetical protein
MGITLQLKANLLSLSDRVEARALPSDMREMAAAVVSQQAGDRRGVLERRANDRGGIITPARRNRDDKPPPHPNARHYLTGRFRRAVMEGAGTDAHVSTVRPQRS